MKLLSIKDHLIPYEERRSVRYTRITISMLEDRLRISAPKMISAKQLKAVLADKQGWILDLWIEHRNSQKKPVTYRDGQNFLYRGIKVELRINRHLGKLVRVSLEGQVLEVCLPEDLADQDDSSTIHTALIKWYKAQARKVLLDRLDKQAERMQVSFHTFRLKEQKTRWGSCSSKRNINLNWRVIMAPDAAIDYIIIHELAHLTHLNHSRQFWQRVAEFMPDYEDWKKWFKDHGRELGLVPIVNRSIGLLYNRATSMCKVDIKA